MSDARQKLFLLVRQRRFLLGGLLLVLLAWLIIFLLTPPFEAPDENKNYAYVQSLASGHLPRLPAANEEGESELGIELERSYWFDSIAFHENHIVNSLRPPIDESRSDSVDSSMQATHEPLYFITASVFYRMARFAGFSAAGTYYATRLASLGFFLLFVGGFWKVAGMVMEDRAAQYLTMAIALQPTLLMIATCVNADIGVVALMTLAIGVLLAGLRSGSTRLSFAVLMGVLSGAAFWAKFPGVILIPVVLICLAWSVKSEAVVKLRLIGAYLLSTLAVISPWLFINLIRYHSLLNSNGGIVERPEINTDTTSIIMIPLNDLRQSLYSFAGNFGWLDAPVFLELRLIYPIIVATLIVLAVWIYIKREKLDFRFDHLPFVSTLAVTFLMVFLISFSLLMALKYYWVFPLQGRYYLVCLLPASLLFFSGLKRILCSLSDESIARGVFFVSIIYFLINVIFTLLPRYYV
ncbi:MAG: DUF2142 domain-containing protein [Thermoleophilia bacterium]